MKLQYCVRQIRLQFQNIFLWNNSYVKYLTNTCTKCYLRTEYLRTFLVGPAGHLWKKFFLEKTTKKYRKGQVNS